MTFENMIANAMSAAKGGRKGPFSQEETRRAMSLLVDSLTAPAVEDSLLGRAEAINSTLSRLVDDAKQQGRVMRAEADSVRRKVEEAMEMIDGLDDSVEALTSMPEDAATVVKLVRAVSSSLVAAVERKSSSSFSAQGDARTVVPESVAREAIRSTSYIVWGYLTGKDAVPNEGDES